MLTNLNKTQIQGDQTKFLSIPLPLLAEFNTSNLSDGYVLKLASPHPEFDLDGYTPMLHLPSLNNLVKTGITQNETINMITSASTNTHYMAPKPQRMGILTPRSPFRPVLEPAWKHRGSPRTVDNRSTQLGSPDEEHSTKLKR